MLSVQRVNNGFNARGFCNNRTYHYYLPTTILGLALDGETMLSPHNLSSTWLLPATWHSNCARTLCTVTPSLSASCDIQYASDVLRSCWLRLRSRRHCSLHHQSCYITQHAASRQRTYNECETGIMCFLSMTSLAVRAHEHRHARFSPDKRPLVMHAGNGSVSFALVHSLIRVQSNNSGYNKSKHLSRVAGFQSHASQ